MSTTPNTPTLDTVAPGACIIRRADGTTDVIEPAERWHSPARPTRPRGRVGLRRAVNQHEELAEWGVSVDDVTSGAVTITSPGRITPADLGIIEDDKPTAPDVDMAVHNQAHSTARNATVRAVGKRPDAPADAVNRLLSDLAASAATHDRMIDLARNGRDIRAHIHRLAETADELPTHSPAWQSCMREASWLLDTLNLNGRRLKLRDTEHRAHTRRANIARKRLAETSTERAKERTRTLARARKARQRKRERIARNQALQSAILGLGGFSH